MEIFLTGAGHFGFGFISGAIAFFILMIVFSKQLFVQMYAPFLPFVVGLIAALPYAFWFQKTCDFPFYANMFYLYGWAHCNTTLIHLSGNLHFVVLVCGLIYGLIVLRYITLVKRVRRYGWSTEKRVRRG